MLLPGCLCFMTGIHMEKEPATISYFCRTETNEIFQRAPPPHPILLAISVVASNENEFRIISLSFLIATGL
jgi:hypothetical protein